MINIQEKAFFTVRDRNHKLRMTKVVEENINTFYIISLTVFISIIPLQDFLRQEHTCISWKYYYSQWSTFSCLLLSCKFFFLVWLKPLSLLIDVPFRVTNLQYKGGCSSINVTWNPPSRDAEGGIVTGYLAQIKEVSSEEPWLNWTTNNVSQSTQSCLFTQLKQERKYHIRVMAQNNMGYGWPSEKSKVSTIQAGD